MLGLAPVPPTPALSPFTLFLVTSEGLVPHRLPAEGSVTIGRGEGNTIRIDDGSVSRQHAVLHVGPGAALRIEDLGGANGTHVHVRSRASQGQTESLQPVRGASLPLAAGDRLVIGGVSAVVHRGTSESSLGDGTTSGQGSVIVADARMLELRAELDRAAGSLISVLLLGETGVGKEVAARALHGGSTRASGPFVAVNCAALPESLLEAELFGHEKGAFTGALHARPGLFESADGGSLFLDEIGELSPGTQAKLLRVLEDRKVTRIGGRTPQAFNVRFISATHRDLEAAAERGEFRNDLYFRLAGLIVSIPPLRERTAEVAPLARLFLERCCRELERPALEVAPETLAILERYGWPGNVRELRNAMERATVLVRGFEVLPEHLPQRIRVAPPQDVAPRPMAPPNDAPSTALGEVQRLRDDLYNLERARVIETLERCAGNQTRAAEQLGISRRTLLKRLDEYNLPRPRK
jgi:DNA-binding NtrC family response regulator